MVKRVLFTAFIVLLLGFQAVKAQENNSSASTSLRLAGVPKHAISIQFPNSLTKSGIGVRFGYDYTDNLRFTIEGNYYYYSSKRATKRTVDMYDLNNRGTIAWGRQADINFNANFIFGKEQFHMYIIVGFYATVGYSKAGKIVPVVYDLVTLGEITVSEDDGIENAIYLEDGYKYYYKDRVDQFHSFGGGLNVGFGAEYQCNKRSRIFLDQNTTIGSMLGIFIKVGYSWCF